MPSRHMSAAIAAAALLAAPGLAGAGTVAGSIDEHRAGPTATLRFKPSTPELAACFPHASATARVQLTTDPKGFDTVTVNASGLKPKTTFTLFLLQKSGAPFGAAEYFGDFTTDAYGRATNSYKLIAEEAFAFNAVTGSRQDLNAMGFWFGDPKDDDGCLGASSPVTPFDGDASAGVQMMNSGITRLP